jgi:hypothetical protein
MSIASYPLQAHMTKGFVSIFYHFYELIFERSKR